MSLLRFEQELTKLREEVRHWKGEHGDAVRREAKAVWDIDQVKDDLDEAVRLLRLIRPHIPPTAIDGEKAKTHPVSECYLNTLADTFLAKRKASKP